MDSPAQCLMMLHSLPALYFFDKEKNGRLTEPEFTSLVLYCQTEKQKVEEMLLHDKNLRDLILRASKAGVKDCSMHGRTSYRRLSSYCNVRSVFSSRRPPKCHASDFSSTAALTNTSLSPLNSFPDSQHVRSNSVAVPYPHDYASGHQYKEVIPDVAPCSASFDNTDGCRISYSPARFTVTSSTAVAMFSSERSLNQDPDNPDCAEQAEISTLSTAACSDPDLLNPQNRTAVDVAVLENIISSSIHKLADLLHTDGSREKFMSWLWKLADFNGSGVVTLEELRIFLAALSEDGIDLSELVFHREDAEPMEVCIINEFDTTHAGLLSKDEFMVLADLVTREYEFWGNRHLDRIGDYELGRTIGRGSSGVVRLAMHVETREKYAIKIIKKGKCSDLSRLDREIQSLMAAKHKHIVALEEVLDSENNIFIVMELCGGGSMMDIVRLYPEERMPEETARFFMRQVFEALAFCHDNGICHRDIRLDNLMLDNCGNAKITDFGHSGMYTPGWDIFSTSLVGSVYNLSPEQVTGQVYSGEKIDIWSAGVAVFCLLVGRPPFYDPDVHTLLEKIPAGNFEVPDFVSPAAKSFIECMIRPIPEERISICQMLHHEWFYDGPEYGPSMNVVMFPVDVFFRKRPDIAEMILAITIYQHSLHFHLADTQNPHSSPNELRGQDWTLRCLCPKNDIKFTVSLFTRKPHSLRKQSLQLPDVSSTATTISPSASVDGVVELNVAAPPPKETSHYRAASITGFEDVRANFGTSPDQKQCYVLQKDDSLGKKMSTTLRPPRQRKPCKVTPMNIAARLREASSAMGRGCADPFDFEPNGREDCMMVQSFREDMFYGDRNELMGEGDNDRNDRRTCHIRSQSLDELANVRRVNRSATVDAFPYHKVYPQRQMPESARQLNFGKPEAGMNRSSDDMTQSMPQLSKDLSFKCLSAPITPTFEHPSFGDGRALPFSDLALHSPLNSTARDEEIAEEISRHPSKTISPQVAQISLSELPAHQSETGGCASTGVVVASEREAGSTCCDTDNKSTGSSVSDQSDVNRYDNGSCSARKGGCESKSVDSGMQPFIEVRLLDGEAGLFLKICRKLKSICETKLAAAAQRQKSRTCGRRTLTALRRTASARCGGHMRTAA